MEACRGAEIPEIDECHPDDHGHGSGNGEGSGILELAPGGFMEVTNDAYRSGSGSGDASANLDFMNDADGGVDGSGSGDASANLDFMHDADGGIDDTSGSGADSLNCEFIPTFPESL